MVILSSEGKSCAKYISKPYNEAGVCQSGSDGNCTFSAQNSYAFADIRG